MARDPVLPRLEDILDCVTVALTDHPVCRLFIHPGGSAPWDACGQAIDGAEGQAWVTVPSPLYPVDPFPIQDTGAQRCHPVEYAADVTVGVLRCAHTVDDQGNPPTAEQVTADAGKVTRDAALIRDALLCCFALDDDDPGIFRLGAWTPLGPSGGCVGGQWAATVRVPACRCEEDHYG